MANDGNHAVTKAELDAALSAFEERIGKRFEEMIETMRGIETNLLTAFHSYARGVSVRMATHDSQYVAMNERMNALEERMLNLETRYGLLGGRRGPGA